MLTHVDGTASVSAILVPRSEERGQPPALALSPALTPSTARLSPGNELRNASSVLQGRESSGADDPDNENPWAGLRCCCNERKDECLNIVAQFPESGSSEPVANSSNRAVAASSSRLPPPTAASCAGLSAPQSDPSSAAARPHAPTVQARTDASSRLSKQTAGSSARPAAPGSGPSFALASPLANAVPASHTNTA